MGVEEKIFRNKRCGIPFGCQQVGKTVLGGGESHKKGEK